MNSRIIELLPPKRELTQGWPRIYRDVDSVPGRTLPPDCQSYYLCVRPYGGDSKRGIDGCVVMFSLNGGLCPHTYTSVANIEHDVTQGKLEQVPNGLRMMIELEP